MGILSGPEIQVQMGMGRIQIYPFDPRRLGPNSYDVCLGRELLIIEPFKDENGICLPLDLTKQVVTKSEMIPDEGFVLQPGVGYLGCTIERIVSHGYVPWIDGRSSVGRAHLQVHQTAGRGDDGWDGTFTLELFAAFLPIRVYAGLAIGQVSFFKLEGERNPYKGSYLGQTGPRAPKPLLRD